MQLFIGGACAGKRDAVTARFPDAVWHRLAPGKRLEECQQALVADTPLVITGVLEWLEARPDVDLASWTLLRIAEDTAYCGGVWRGIAAEGSFGAIRPEFTRIPGLRSDR